MDEDEVNESEEELWDEQQQHLDGRDGPSRLDWLELESVRDASGSQHVERRVEVRDLGAEKSAVVVVNGR